MTEESKKKISKPMNKFWQELATSTFGEKSKGLEVLAASLFYAEIFEGILHRLLLFRIAIIVEITV